MSPATLQTLKNLLYNVVSFGVNYGVAFFLTPYLVKHVGREAYGFLPLVNSIIGYSSILTSAIGSMSGRFVTMAMYKDDIPGANRYFNSVWVANAAFSALFTVVAVFFVVFADSLINVPGYLLTEVRWLFGLGTASLVFGLLTGYLAMGTFVKNRTDMTATRNIVLACANVAVIVALFSLFPPSIVYISVASLAIAPLSFCFNLSLKRKLLPELTLAPRRFFSFKAVKEVFFSGIWNSLNQLSNVLLQQIDLLITNIFIGAAATGSYALAKIAPTFVYSVLAVLSSSFSPRFNILFAQGKVAELVGEIKKSMKIVGFLVGIPIGLLLAYGKEFYALWVPSEDALFLYRLTVVTVAPLMIGGSINPIFGVFSATNKLRVPSLVVLGAGTANTVAIFVLLSTTNLGIWAIAIVGAVQGGLRNLLFTPSYGAACLGRKWHTFYPVMIKGCLGMAVVALGGFAFKQVLPADSWLKLLLSGAGAAAATAFVNLFFVFDRFERTALYSAIRGKFAR